jgi:hypothetical protein
VHGEGPHVEKHTDDAADDDEDDLIGDDVFGVGADYDFDPGT